jgi:hypothetical protein
MKAKCCDNSLIESKLLRSFQHPPTNPSALNSNHVQEFLAQTSKKLSTQLQMAILGCIAISNDEVIHQVKKGAADSVNSIGRQFQDMMSRISGSGQTQNGQEEKRLREELSAVQRVAGEVERATDVEIKAARGAVHDEYVRCSLRQLVHQHFKVPPQLEVQPHCARAPCP